MSVAARTAHSGFAARPTQGDFTITSGTIFAFSQTAAPDNYLAAIAIFCNEVKGKSALALSRDLECPIQDQLSSWQHKLREAMGFGASPVVGGADKTAEIDGAYFGGYIKPANRRDVRIDRRLKRNQNGKRQCVVVVRERDGRTLTGVFKSESDAVGFIRSSTADGTLIQADEASAWDRLHAKYEMGRINHKQAYSLAGACTNVAESFFSPDASRRTGPSPSYLRPIPRSLRQ